MKYKPTESKNKQKIRKKERDLHNVNFSGHWWRILYLPLCMGFWAKTYWGMNGTLTGEHKEGDPYL